MHIFFNELYQLVIPPESYLFFLISANLKGKDTSVLFEFYLTAMSLNISPDV